MGGGGEKKIEKGGGSVCFLHSTHFFILNQVQLLYSVEEKQRPFYIVPHLTNSLRGNSSLQVCICSFNKIITFKIHSLE